MWLSIWLMMSVVQCNYNSFMLKTFDICLKSLIINPIVLFNYLIVIVFFTSEIPVDINCTKDCTAGHCLFKFLTFHQYSHVLLHTSGLKRFKWVWYIPYSKMCFHLQCCYVFHWLFTQRTFLRSVNSTLH